MAKPETQTVTDVDPDTPPKVSWKMLLGENGCGKSTVLKGLAMALMGENFFLENQKRYNWKPRKLFNNKTRQRKGWIHLTMSKGEDVRIELTRNKL